MTARRDRRPRRTLVACAVTLIGAVLLSGCFALRQGREFTVGSEPNRVSLVIHRPYAASLDDVAFHDFDEETGRQTILGASPATIDVSDVYDQVCGLDQRLCIGPEALSELVTTWWRADVQQRPELHDALHQARTEDMCLAWTFVSITGRYFTTKPRGTAGCQ